MKNNNCFICRPIKYLALTCLIVNATNVYSQSADSVFVKSNFWSGTKFYKSDHLISKTEVRRILANHEALGELNKGLSSQGTATALSTIGGVCIGWPIGAALGNAENPPWFLAGPMISIKLSSKYLLQHVS